MASEAVLYPASGVKLVKNVMIPMRDGVRIAADLYMPDGEAAANGEIRFPAVMEYVPYRKDEIHPSRADIYTYLPRHGYVMARVDIRGTGGSEGINTDEYTLQEQLDGYDAIEWLAAQPWCDGHVNMLGISYGGFTALQVATHNPPHLTTIIPVEFTDDRYTDDCHYRGGLLRKYYDVGYYGNFMVVYNALPPYPEWSGAGWAQVWAQHLAENEPYYLKWLTHQTDGPYWRHGSVRDIPERIRCPTFLIGGWRDGYPNPPLRLYQALSVPRKVLVGPWDHAMPDTAIPGPRIDYLHEVVRWLDYWCKGIQNGVMDEPPVVVYVQHWQRPVVDRLESDGEWRAETTWPPAGATEQTLYLCDHHRLEPDLGAAGQATYAYNPTVGITAGLWSGGLGFGLPADQRLDEAHSLVFTSAPLADDLTILGWAHAMLHVASTASVMGFAVSLSDVAPDGSSHLVAKGMLNGARRNSLIDPAPMAPGEIYELQIQIDCTAWKFARGHAIRLSIASADWPNVWPTPEPGENQVYWGGVRPSRLILPVVPAQGSADPPAFLPSRMNVQRMVEAIHPPTWEVTYELASGRVRATIVAVREHRLNETTLIQRENGVICMVDPANPAAASAKGRAVHTIIRPNMTLRGTSDILVQATASEFHVTIDLNLYLNGALHFNKQWSASLPRVLL
jgi:predicted acyl esterase